MATLRLGDGAARLRRLSPARQAFLLLRTVFTLAPILFGPDKFANVLTDGLSRRVRAAGSRGRGVR